MTHLLLPPTAKVYKVGGCVRDKLLGVPSNDTDYVVVGVAPQEMLNLGYVQVGADFPVFLHPQTHDEYALARTERKTGSGYHGFTAYTAPDITLEDDLYRRDFTMNAMAEDLDTGSIIDPYNARRDLQDKVLRHVGPAFSDDPVRVLRGARFAAKYNMTIAPETHALMLKLVDTGEMTSLVPERVRVEFEKGFEGPDAFKMWHILYDLCTLNTLVPYAMSHPDVFAVLNDLPKEAPSVLKWGALLFKAYPNASTQEYKEIITNYRYPKEALYVATTLQKRAEAGNNLDVIKAVKFWTTADAKRQYAQWLQVLEYEGISGYRSTIDWKKLNAACREIQEADLVKSCQTLGLNIAQHLPNVLFEARVERVTQVLQYNLNLDENHDLPGA